MGYLQAWPIEDLNSGVTENKYTKWPEQDSNPGLQVLGAYILGHANTLFSICFFIKWVRFAYSSFSTISLLACFY